MKNFYSHFIVTMFLMTIFFTSIASAQGLIEGKNLLDISQQVEQVMPADPALKLPEINFFGKIGESGGLHNLETISYCVHTGTHMDAPYHVIPDGFTIESWPADILIGPAVIVTVGKPGAYEITKQDVQSWESQHGAIQEGDAVLFHTGHDANWSKGNKDYIDNGYSTIAPDAAKYLVEKRIRYVGVESISPEGPSTEVHKLFLGNGIPVVENICRLGEIARSRCDTIGTFAAVKGATAVWVRLLVMY